MDIAKGFQVEVPAIFIPWKIKPADLLEMADGVTEITRGYYTARCVSLGGLNHQLGFHFGTGSGYLQELGFFHIFEMSLGESFDLFQRHIEQTFGPPTQTEPGSAGFPSHTWRLAGARVDHYVLDRFGPEEHVKIRPRE